MISDMYDAAEDTPQVKPDGTLTQSAKYILRVCEPPATM